VKQQEQLASPDSFFYTSASASATKLSSNFL